MAGIDVESIADAILDTLKAEVRGGDDALITILYRLPEQLKDSRFAETAYPFVHRCMEDSSYIDTLRTYWKRFAVPSEKLPTIATIIKRLEEEVSPR
jgi:hypothetical protein